MKNDLFDGQRCEACGYTWHYESGKPLLYERIDAIERDAGIEYLCRCLNCGGEFVIQYSR